MKFLLNFFCLLLCVNISLSELLCPQKKEPPQEIENDPSFTLDPIIKDGVQYGTIQIADRIFLNKNKEGINYATSELLECLNQKINLLIITLLFNYLMKILILIIYQFCQKIGQECSIHFFSLITFYILKMMDIFSSAIQ